VRAAEALDDFEEQGGPISDGAGEDLGEGGREEGREGGREGRDR